MATGEDFGSNDRFLVLDRAASDHDVSLATALLEQQKHGPPAGDRAQRVETAGKGGLLVIAVRLQRQPHDEPTGTRRVDRNAHLGTHRDLPLQHRLQLS